ncbi:MAG TPA: S46 family peptidase, partial [Thermoanaerobaculia bacterium]|nr:S46 family peptidase [Thermoanaerobaculia bacterium]
MRFGRALIALALSFSAPAGYALEGKWTPQQMLELDAAWLQSIGLEIPPSRLWDPARGTGLLAATINIPGCSAAFVSPTGLIVTNHHCAFSLIQEHSTAERDLLSNGFLARTRAEELPGKTARAAVPRRFTDVTAAIEKAIPRKADDRARAKAIEAKQKELVQRCEKTPGARCRVATFDGGLFYTLIESFEIRDVRLVYAPPLGVGEFGGEIDNWTWPRHTGDFSILRAWVAPDGTSADPSPSNVPYAPEFYFPIPGRDLDPGDFVMVLGYPGTTYRALLAEEMGERRELWFPRREELFGEWIEILEGQSQASDAARIALASKLKTLHNRYKNAQGQVAGLDRGSILEKQRKQDERVAAWAAEKPEFKRSLAAREELRKVLETKLATWERDFLLDNVGAGSVALDLAQKIVHNARERQKPDLERDEDAMQRNLARQRASIDRAQKDYVEAADKALFRSFVRRALALPAGQRIPAVDRIFGAAP